MKIVNIAFVCSKLSGGGAERFTANIANSFSKNQSYKIFVITERKESLEYELDPSIIRIDSLLGEKKIISDIFNIRKICNKYSIDMMVGIDLSINLILCMSNFFTRTRFIISERNSPSHVQISRINKFLRFLFYRNAHGYVFQTNIAKSFYSKRIQSKSIVIHNPIKPNLPQRNKTRNEIIAIGRLHPQKNYDMLLIAFKKISKKFPEYTLRIFGKGEEKERLIKMVEYIKMENKIIFEDYKENLHEEIKNSDIYVLTSNYEGMPNSLLECMSMGFPVISTDCPSGGPAELIKNNENGLLISVNNPEELYEKLCFLIQNQVQKEKMGEFAYKIHLTHSVNYINKLWEEYILAVLYGK